MKEEEEKDSFSVLNHNSECPFLSESIWNEDNISFSSFISNHNSSYFSRNNNNSFINNYISSIDNNYFSFFTHRKRIFLLF